MKKYIITIIASVFLWAGSAHAYHLTSQSNEAGGSGIGFFAGSTYGLGIGFRYQARNNPVGFQLAGFPMFHEGEGLFTAGAGLTLSLHDSGTTRTFLSLCGSVVHKTKRHPSNPPQPGEYRVTSETTGAFGPGVGIEWKLHKHIGFTLDIPIAFIWEKDRTIDEYEVVSVLPVPNLALMYTW